MAEKLDSFDDRVTADWGDKYNATSTGANNTVTITSSAGRNSTNGLRIARGAGSAGTFFALTTFANRTRYQMAWAGRFSTLPPAAETRDIAAMRDTGTVQGSVRLNSNGTLTIMGAGVARVTSSLAISAGVQYHFEWDYTVDNAAGASELLVNGVQYAVITGVDTQATGAAQINEIGPYLFLTATTDTNFNYDIDDLIIHDQDAFIGDHRVGFYQSDGAGNHSEWTANGAATIEECVDEAAQDGDTTYASSGTLNDRYTLTFADVPTTAVIKFLQHVVYAKKSDAGAREISPLVRISSTDYVASSIALGVTYTRLLQMQNLDPATAAAWTAAGLNASEIGDKVTT